MFHSNLSRLVDTQAQWNAERPLDAYAGPVGSGPLS